jgi:DNA-binding NtrC family response regulator
MKLLLVMGSDKTYDAVTKSLKLPGFEFIRYRHVQKAMDNIEEVDPAGIIISAVDFPRHWKTLASFVRSGRPGNACLIVILNEAAFPEEEANKALTLEVNYFDQDSLDNPSETEKIRALLSRCKPAESGQNKNQNRKETQTRFAFVFSNPADEKIITGTVRIASSSRLSFAPDRPALAKNLSLGVKLPNCSFRAGTEILSPFCILRKTGKVIDLDFISFPKGEKEKLNNYLESLL